jgi:hypothetical protein
MSPTERSLFAHLTDSAGKYPATEHIAFLLKPIAYDACSAHHNTLTFCKLVEAIRDTCKNIDKLIAQVDSSNSNDDTEAWRGFDIYTAAIGPLAESGLHISLNFTLVDSMYHPSASSTHLTKSQQTDLGSYWTVIPPMT